MFMRHIQKAELFTNIFAWYNILGMWAVYVKYFGKKL